MGLVGGCGTLVLLVPIESRMFENPTIGTIVPIPGTDGGIFDFELTCIVTSASCTEAAGLGVDIKTSAAPYMKTIRTLPTPRTTS